jgi:PPPDE putative peptidase domain
VKIFKVNFNFRDNKYHLLDNNCHCFAQELSKLVGGDDLPDWIKLPEWYVRKGVDATVVAGVAGLKVSAIKFGINSRIN